MYVIVISCWLARMLVLEAFDKKENAYKHVFHN